LDYPSGDIHLIGRILLFYTALMTIALTTASSFFVFILIALAPLSITCPDLFDRTYIVNSLLGLGFGIMLVIAQSIMILRIFNGDLAGALLIGVLVSSPPLLGITTVIGALIGYYKKKRGGGASGFESILFEENITDTIKSSPQA